MLITTTLRQKTNHKKKVAGIIDKANVTDGIRHKRERGRDRDKITAIGLRKLDAKAGQQQQQQQKVALWVGNIFPSISGFIVGWSQTSITLERPC